MLGAVFRLILIAVAVLLTLPAMAQDRSDGRLFYEMVVTNPGTRSQGWHGTLYGPDGSALTAAPGAKVETAIGTFQMQACELLWDPCGFIREGAPPRAGVSSIDVLTDPLGWTFRVYVTAEGSRSEGWRGALWHGDSLVEPLGAEPVETAMGRFLPLAASDVLWGWSGWQPEDWAPAPPQ